MTYSQMRTATYDAVKCSQKNSVSDYVHMERRLSVPVISTTDVDGDLRL
jgi:hypothetical protein